MQNRVMQYVRGNSNAVSWLGTFHSISEILTEGTLKL